jgi:hypothetical protein
MGLWLKNEDGFVPVSGGGGGGGDLTWPLLAPDGTRFAPSYSFGTDGSSGLYLADDGSVRIAAEGSDAIGFDDRFITLGGQQQGVGRMSILAGSSGSPVYGFEGDIGTGIYRAEAGVLGVSTGGVEWLRVGSSSTFTGNLAVTGRIDVGDDFYVSGINVEAGYVRHADGDYSWPSISFQNDMQAGFYLAGPQKVGLRGDLKVHGSVYVQDGTAAEPSYSFADESVLGFYLKREQVMGISGWLEGNVNATFIVAGDINTADVLDRAETATMPVLDDGGVATTDADVESLTVNEVVTALLTKVKELSAEIEELKAKDRPLKKQAAPRKKAATRKTTTKKEDS